MLYYSYGKQCTPFIYNVFTISHYTGLMNGLVIYFLPNMYCVSLSTHCLKQAMPSLQIHICVYTVYYSYNRTPNSQSRKPTLKSFFAVVSMHAYFRSLHGASVYSAI